LVTDQWFVTITDIKDTLLNNIDDSEWHPQWARDNRFRDFIQDAPDWNVSRQRYWGIPIPIWVPEHEEGALGEDMIVIGTREELADRVEQEIDPTEIDLHRPSVDDLTITEDGTTYRRVEDVFDVWLDSSVASWGTLGYAGEADGRQEFDSLWPADLIVEAHDQTRGWFWSQLGMGSAAVDQIPYDEVLMHGFANDENGRKMSKSRGNIVTPEEAIERAGRDPLRTYLLSHDQQGVDLSFEWDGLGETVGTFNIFWNVFRFPLPYMDLDDYDPATAALSDGELTEVDRWVLSRLQSTKREVTHAWDDYRISDAVTALLEFVTSDVSRYYVKAIRDRMWMEDDSASKRGAYATLSTVLDETIRMLAPVAPYITERMYQLLDGSATTVHALSSPTVDEGLRDPELEDRIAIARKVEETAATARQQGDRKLRWPVSRVVVESDDTETRTAVESLEELLADRVNAREIVAVEEFDELVEYVEPQMSEIGPAFGADAQRVMDAVSGTPRSEFETTASDDVAGTITLDGDRIELHSEMVSHRAEAPDGVIATAFDAIDGVADGGTVYVDIGLSPELESEGYARDVIRRVQEMRGNLDLPVDARIKVGLDIEDDRVSDFVDDHRELIATETRTDQWLSAPEDVSGMTEEWQVEDRRVTIGVEPASPEAKSD
jgi:Isoleucyl-tRNA synthetase